jgi:hypothetical protein
MGAGGLERALIGTLANCVQCGPSPNWLGRDSPKPQIRESGLWLIQHLNAAPLSDAERNAVSAALGQTS